MEFRRFLQPSLWSAAQNGSCHAGPSRRSPTKAEASRPRDEGGSRSTIHDSRFTLRARFQPVELPGQRVGLSQPEANHQRSRAFFRSRPSRFSVSAFQHLSGSQFTIHDSRFTNHQRSRAFTLLELIVVLSIIILMTVLVAPAFTNRKSADDMTNAAYTISGMLGQARTYAKANNTYTWIGFAGSVGSNTTAVTGQVSIAIVASQDGTDLWTANNALPAASLTPVGKMVTLSSVHIGDTGVPSGDGTEFESRPTVDSNHRISSAPNTAYPFTVQQTSFNKWIQFNPRGEALVNGGGFSTVNYAEVGVLPTHGTALGVTQSGNVYLGNLAAIEISGVGGNVRIYRR